MMQDTVLQPDLMNEPDLIPYPQGFGRWLLRLPLVFYRMGLGDLMNAAHIMILATRGRKSGLTRHTPIEYRRHGSKLYVISAWRERPQWLQNLKAAPDVLIQQGKRQFGARAEIVTNAGEALRVLHLFRRRAPFVYDPLIARLSERERIDERTLPEVTEKITIVRIDPTPTMPDLHPLPSSYGWVLPTMVGVGVILMLLISMTRNVSTRRQRDGG
jgi:deazaflavin-dependent oxidoreductase (nitroreductase family)